MHHRRSSSDGKFRPEPLWGIFKGFREYLHAQMKSGEATLLKIQKYEHPALTVAAKVASFFGTETFYISCLGIILWTVEWRFGVLFAQLLAMSLTLGNVLKNIFLLPRPQSPPVRVLDVEHDWGLPSTHALTAVALGGYIWIYVWQHQDAWHLSNTFILSLGAAILVWAFCVMTSRMYLGVHSPVDIYTGIIVGSISLAAYTLFDDSLDAWLLETPASSFKGILGCVLVITLHPKPYPTTSYYTSVIILGMASGFYLAHADYAHHIIMHHAITFPRSPLMRLLRLVSGLVALFALKELQKLFYYPILDMFCKLLGISYVKHVATTLERQPSFTHLGVLNKLLGYYRIQKLQKQVRVSNDSIPVDPLIRHHETNMELIFNHRRYLINIDVVVKFFVYGGLAFSSLYFHKLYIMLGI